MTAPVAVPFAPASPLATERLGRGGKRAIRKSDRAASRAAKAKRLLRGTRPKHPKDYR